MHWELIFFFYILSINHYRSSAIKMLHLNHLKLFKKYLTIQHTKICQNSTQTNGSNLKLLKIRQSHHPCSTSLT